MAPSVSVLTGCDCSANKYLYSINHRLTLLNTLIQSNLPFRTRALKCTTLITTAVLVVKIPSFAVYPQKR